MNRTGFLKIAAFALLAASCLCSCGSESDAAETYAMPTAVSQQKNETSLPEETTSEASSTTTKVLSESTAEQVLSENDEITEFQTETVTDFFEDETAESETSSETAVAEETTVTETESSFSETTTISETLPAETTTVSSAAETEAAEPQKTDAAEASMVFSFGGASLKVGESAEKFISTVSPSFTESAPSCYGNGEDINYCYDDFTVYVWNENDNYLTYAIDIFGVNVPTEEGISIDVKVAQQ